MDDKEEVTTLEFLRTCINKPGVTIFAQLRFGTSEQWVKISKAEARNLITGMSGSPEHYEMYTGSFGEMNFTEKTLYLG